MVSPNLTIPNQSYHESFRPSSLSTRSHCRHLPILRPSRRISGTTFADPAQIDVDLLGLATVEAATGEQNGKANEEESFHATGTAIGIARLSDRTMVFRGRSGHHRILPVGNVMRA